MESNLINLCAAEVAHDFLRNLESIFSLPSSRICSLPPQFPRPKGKDCPPTQSLMHPLPTTLDSIFDGVPQWRIFNGAFLSVFYCLCSTASKMAANDLQLFPQIYNPIFSRVGWATYLLLVRRIKPKWWNITFKIRLQNDSDFWSACPLFLTLTEARYHAVSCPLESPTLRGTEGGLQPQIPKKLNPVHITWMNMEVDIPTVEPWVFCSPADNLICIL